MSGSLHALGLGLALALAVALGLAWWVVVVSEGAYLGAGVVTWMYDLTARRYEGIKDFDRAEDAQDLALPLLHALEAEGAAEAAADARVLDVACGTGRLARALLDLPWYRGEVLGLDLSPGMLDEAARLLADRGLSERAPLLCHAAAPLPFANGSFDAVTCLEALEFLPDRDAALAEMARVLRPGGRLLITNRVGWEARLLPGRAEPTAALCARLSAAGFAAPVSRRWTTLYDLVEAQRAIGEPCGLEVSVGAAAEADAPSSPAQDAPTASDPAARGWLAALRCPACGGVGFAGGPDGARAEGVDGPACRRCGHALRRAGGWWRL